MIQLDLTYLNAISGGDRSFIQEMLTMFLNTTFPEIETLKKHASSASWEMFGSTAHKMKAPLQMLGVPVVSDLILELEMVGKHKKGLEEANSKVALLENYIQQLEVQIKNVLAQ